MFEVLETSKYAWNWIRTGNTVAGAIRSRGRAARRAAGRRLTPHCSLLLEPRPGAILLIVYATGDAKTISNKHTFSIT